MGLLELFGFKIKPKELTKQDKIDLILQKRKPSGCYGDDGYEEESYYYQLVTKYTFGYVFGQADPRNGTHMGKQDGLDIVIQPHSEEHRNETENACKRIRESALFEFGLDLHKLAFKNE